MLSLEGQKSMKLYKLTDENFETYGHTKWGENVTHEGTGNGSLCGPGWIHAYTSPELAVLLNPMHANFKNPVLWEAEGNIDLNDQGLKVGSKKLTTIKIIPVPEITITQKIAFGILCALEVYQEDNFVTWAKNWLTGADRSSKNANAYAAAYDAVRGAASNAAANAANLNFTEIIAKSLKIK